MHNEELHVFISLQNYPGDKIKKNEMGRAYSMYGGEVRCFDVVI